MEDSNVGNAMPDQPESTTDDIFALYARRLVAKGGGLTCPKCAVGELVYIVDEGTGRDILECSECQYFED